MTNEKGERSYPFHNPSEQKSVQSLFNDKFIKNRAAGVGASEVGLPQEKTFSGFKRESMDHLFVVELQLSEETAKEIADRVTGPMEKIAESLGIRDSLVVAGNGDQAAHVTLHVGRFEKMSPEKQRTIVNWLAGTNEEGKHLSHLDATTQILTGLKFKMDAIFNSGRDTSIAASSVDGDNQGAAYRVRKIFEKVLDRAQNKFAEGDEKIGQHYPRYDDIFHTTVARFTKPVSAENLAVFNKRVMEEIGSDLKDHPINIQVENARTIIATKGVEERKPDLLS